MPTVTMPAGQPRALGTLLEPTGEAHSSPPHGNTASAPCLFKCPHGHPTVTQGGFRLFPGTRLLPPGRLFSTTPTGPLRPGPCPVPACWGSTDAVPCDPLSCMRDLPGSPRQPDTGLCAGEDAPENHTEGALDGLEPPGQGSAGLRALLPGALPWPGPQQCPGPRGAAHHLGHFPFGVLLCPSCEAALPGPRLGFVGSQGPQPHPQEQPGICSHRWEPPDLEPVTWPEEEDARGPEAEQAAQLPCLGGCLPTQGRSQREPEHRDTCLSSQLTGWP